TQAGIVEKAALYLEQAGDRARSLYANTEAVAVYRELVQRLDDAGRQVEAARIREKLGGVLSVMARYEEAIATLSPAAEAYRQSGMRSDYLRVAAQIGWQHALRGRPEEGLALLRPLLDRTDASVPSGELADAYSALAHLSYVAGHYAEQLTAAEQAATLA